MSRPNLILTLAKVIIAAAWADGEIDNHEINNLKDLLFHLPNITGREWGTLEMYIEAPVGAGERTRLVKQLQSELRSTADQQFALEAITAMIEAGYGRDNPYLAGIVQLEEGVKISAQILGADPGQPDTNLIGTPVEVEFVERGEGEEKQTFLAFRAA